jgi:hypothetical protein
MDRARTPGSMSPQHAGLRRRVAALLRPTVALPVAVRPDPPPPADDDVGALRRRVERLEALVESLQDALYRHSQLQDERDEALHRKTEPEEIARALSADQRRRGL